MASAIALLQETPWTEIRLSEIAKLADTQPSVVVRYFGNKQSLFNEISQRSRSELAERLRPSADLAEAMDEAFDYIVGNPWVARLFAEVVLNRSASGSPATMPTMDLLVPLLEDEQTKRSGPTEGVGSSGVDPDAAPRVDARLLVFLMMIVIGGWASYEDYVTTFFVQDLDRDDLRRQVRRIVREMIRREIGG